jgi:hypothetical protein
VQVLAANALFFACELAAGIAAHSLALIADAGHMLSDAGALALALVAASFAERPPTPRKSYGFYRAEILAALGNGLALVAIAAYVLVQAVRRLGSPPPAAAWFSAWLRRGLPSTCGPRGGCVAGADSTCARRGCTCCWTPPAQSARWPRGRSC